MNVMVIESERDMSSYVLTVEEASRLFAEAGVPRSPRTVLRYCAQNSLDCAHADTEKNWKYLIKEESVRERIKEVEQIAPSSHDATRPAITSQDPSERDSGEIEQVKNENQELKGQVKDLEAKNRGLEISNAAKDQFMDMARDQWATLSRDLQGANHRLGVLEERLAIAAPADKEPPQTQPEPPNPSGTEASPSDSQPGSVL